MDLRALLTALFDSPSREFDVELWDGHRLISRTCTTAVGRVVLRSPAALGRLIPPVDERGIAHAFVVGEVDIVGDTIGVLEAIGRWEGPRLTPLVWPRAAPALARALALSLSSRVATFGPRHTIDRDAHSVRGHYDRSDDFYRLLLDQRLVYSCGYFPHGSESIDDAQHAKIELACRKLGLREGDRLLDVGCGWGALLVHTAELHGVHAIGTTISRSQFAEARRRAAASSARGRIEVLDRDYRRIPPEPVDKIVSIGMMEHVGEKNLDGYFAHLYRRLVSGGLLLNQAIAEIPSAARTIPWLRRSSGGFISRDIFPNSDLPSIGKVIAAAERQGFEVRDVECMREHYDRTLQLWLARLEGRFDDALAMAGLRTARAWRLYLATSAVGFRLGQIGVYQTLLAKRATDGRARGLPWSRATWYQAPLVTALSRHAAPEQVAAMRAE